MNIKIMVATHKKYKMPADSELYIPIFVGSALHPKPDESYCGDDTGDNISEKNPNFNELTALYWGWKNLDCDYIGLDHYRRYMTLNKSKDLNSVLSKKEIEKILKKTDVILPSKRHYYIESNYSHYIHAHYTEPLTVTKKIISDECPEYLPAFKHVMNQRSAHMFNMFIMKKSMSDNYCNWLFGILFKLERDIDISNYDSYEQRVFGFVSELLLDVWLETNGIKYAEVNKVNLENEHWGSKILGFLSRKFFGK